MHTSGPLSCAHLPRAGACGAFSLIELILVLAIMATTAAIAAPRYANAVSRYRVDLAARRIVADLDLTRSQARASSRMRGLEFDVAADSYAMFDGAAQVSALQVTTVSLADPPYNVRIVSPVFDTDAKILFDGYGVPDSGGSVIVQSGGYQKTVVLDADTGKGEVQ